MKSIKPAILFGLAFLCVNSASGTEHWIENDPAAMLYFQKPLAMPAGQDDSPGFGLNIGLLSQPFEIGLNAPLAPYSLASIVNIGLNRSGVDHVSLNDVTIWAGEHIDISRTDDPRIEPSRWAWVGIAGAVLFGASCAAGGFPCNSFMDGEVDLSQPGKTGFNFHVRPKVPKRYDRVKVE